MAGDIADKKILVTGGSGRLGLWLKRAFHNALFPEKAELDIGCEHSIRNYLRKQKPCMIIHAAALTSAGACDADRARAWSINVVGTENLFKQARLVVPEAYFAYISTAGVFSGEEGNYDEASIPYPCNFYCFTKYAAEERIREKERTCIIRTNFIGNGKWPHEYGFSDRYGTYLLASDVALGIKEIITSNATGIVHLCGDKKMSLFDVAKKVDSSVKPIKYEKYKGPFLPKDLSLKTIAWKTYAFGFSLKEGSLFREEGQ